MKYYKHFACRQCSKIIFKYRGLQKYSNSMLQYKDAMNKPKWFWISCFYSFLPRLINPDIRGLLLCARRVRDFGKYIRTSTSLLHKMVPWRHVWFGSWVERSLLTIHYYDPSIYTCIHPFPFHSALFGVTQRSETSSLLSPPCSYYLQD